ncbi:hypothetical protein FIA58_004925 [Flavobacterium jejuense]|uniref:Lipoprotein n=1 Tax=Flavobacterium jejuense TaxID=1544455 RepID=A0ABX0ISC7_9FLAO|nr:hypothetical protein [Flavobacterium jejuense]NHN25016.1 hypothetical protein [Flavobacterium jejuense]
MSKYLLVLFLFSILSCKKEENKKTETQTVETAATSDETEENTTEALVQDTLEKTEKIQIPKTFKILDETEGDLDKDGIPEKVIVYDTEKETDLGTERQIYIYKNNNGKWEFWKKAIGAVLPSQHGGMMGDPFDEISIERNCIVINHFGGSRQKWNYTHRFRYQGGDFQLIGATVNFGSPCDYFETMDYNLSNGKINYEKETEDCENDTSKVEKEEMVMKRKTLPTMNGFYPGNNEVKFPNSETTIYY